MWRQINVKRDLDLVRAILITAENSDEPIGDDVLLSIEPDAKKMAYHLELMQAYGLINVTVKYDGLNKTPYMLKLHSVTWGGYDYLDAIRSARVWDKAKASMLSALGEVSLLLAKETSLMVARQLIQQQLS